LEFLAFSGLSENDRCLFSNFLCRVNVIGLSETDDVLHQSIIQKRRDLGLRLPDAIILATALAHHACLMTDDDGLLKASGPSARPLPSTA
jgi:predicted nucleic acid-binding protein